MLEINTAMAKAEVYKVTNKGVYLIKVRLPDIELYIHGIRVQKSKYSNQPLFVQLPTYEAEKGSGKWIKPFECAQNGAFKQFIDRVAIEAVESYESSTPYVSKKTNNASAQIDISLEDTDEVVGKGIDNFLNSEPP
jgi:hypothetical protein